MIHVLRVQMQVDLEQAVDPAAFTDQAAQQMREVLGGMPGSVGMPIVSEVTILGADATKPGQSDG